MKTDGAMWKILTEFTEIWKLVELYERLQNNPQKFVETDEIWRVSEESVCSLVRDHTANVVYQSPFKLGFISDFFVLCFRILAS